jgi:hypothetical protein
MDDIRRFNEAEKVKNTAVLSAEIAKHTEAFLKNGGKINVIPNGTRHTRATTGFSVVRGADIDDGIKAQRQRDVMMLREEAESLGIDTAQVDLYYRYGQGGGYFLGKKRIGFTAGEAKKTLMALASTSSMS